MPTNSIYKVPKIPEKLERIARKYAPKRTLQQIKQDIKNGKLL